MFKNTKIDNSLLGIVLMLTHAFCLASVHICGAALTKFINPEQVAFFYRASVMLAVLPWCSRGGLVNNLRTKRIKLHLTRGIISCVASICFYHCVSKVDAADASAVSYLEQVVVLCVGLFYFKEKFTIGKLVMIVFGVAGAIMIIKPGFTKFNTHYVLLFVAIMLWSVNNTSIKVLGKTESNKTQVFYTTFFGSILALPFAMQHPWPALDLSLIRSIIILGFFHFVHTVTFFKALKLADMTVVMPFEYTRIMFTSLLGYVFLNKMPNSVSILGYMMIILGGTYIIIEEGMRKKRHREVQAGFTTDIREL